jgi:predicted RNase H-like HicB family nuclease
LKVKTYFAVVHKDEGSAYGVTFPDLPGCFSAADDLESLVPNACEALDLWFEDAEEVEPRDVDAIREAVAVDLSEGAFLIAVPRVTRSNRSVRINVSLDRGTLEAIDLAAAARKLTRSAFIAEAARNEIELAH